MQHASIGQLLSIRDEEPVGAEAVAHLESCDACRLTLAELGDAREALGALPALSPERDLWPEIAARAGLDGAGPAAHRAA